MPTYEESSAGDQAEAETAGMNRRSVVKAGAAVAWSAPVISVLAAAPAYASSTAAKLTSTVVKGTRSSASVPFAGTVSNEPGAAAQAVSLVLTLTSTANIKGATCSAATTADWVGPTKGGVGNNEVTFTFTAASGSIPGGGSRDFGATVTLPNPGTATGTWTATATTTLPGLGDAKTGTF